MSLSFNNDGPLGSFFRYICDNGTYKAYYDDLGDGKENPIDLSKVDVSMDGIELEDREFIAAIKEKREPNGSLAQVLPCMRVLGKLEKIIDPQRKAHAVAGRRVGAPLVGARDVAANGRSRSQRMGRPQGSPLCRCGPRPNRGAVTIRPCSGLTAGCSACPCSR